MKKGRNEERDDWVILSDDDPKIELFDRVVPIWCEVSHDWLEERAAQGYGLGFAGGFMAGVLMAALRPQWAAAYHTLVRRYYLTSGLTPEELQAWERHADATALALPVEIEGNQVMSTLPDSPSWADQYPEFAAKVKRAFERKEPETITVKVERVPYWQPTGWSQPEDAVNYHPENGDEEVVGSDEDFDD